MALSRCPSCNGFVPAAVESCPNCHTAAAPSARNKALRLLLAGVAVPFTLMACYGGPPIEEPKCGGADGGDGGIGQCDAGPQTDAGQ